MEIPSPSCTARARRTVRTSKRLFCGGCACACGCELGFALRRRGAVENSRTAGWRELGPPPLNPDGLTETDAADADARAASPVPPPGEARRSCAGKVALGSECGPGPVSEERARDAPWPEEPALDADKAGSCGLVFAATPPPPPSALAATEDGGPETATGAATSGGRGDWVAVAVADG